MQQGTQLITKGLKITATPVVDEKRGTWHIRSRAKSALFTALLHLQRITGCETVQILPPGSKDDVHQVRHRQHSFPYTTHNQKAVA